MTTELEAFADEVREFLDSNAKRRTAENRKVWGQGSDQVTIFRRERESRRSPEMRARREWLRARFDSGLGWICGPIEHGGRDLSSAHEILYETIESEYDVPDTSHLRMVGLNLVAPTILAHGTLRQCTQFIRPLFRGELIACQLFSEPGAGSDLAGLQTRARFDGTDWIVNGQKVWTSIAHCSDIGELLCRTDPAVAKHNGITAFLVDMDTPGIDVRPLRQMNGGAEFNEVYFTDVRVPDSRRLGPVNGGWPVALTTLMNERSSVGAEDSLAVNGALNIEWLTQLLDSLELRANPAARRRIAEIYVRRTTLDQLNAQLRRTVRSGRTPGPEASAGKLLNSRNVTEAAESISELLGPQMIADNGAWGTYGWSELLLCTPALRLLGGTDEILKNIIAERVLGLPKESSGGVARDGSR